MTDRTLVIDFPNRFEKNPEKEREIKELKNHYFSHLVDLLKEMYENNFNITFCQQMIDSTNRERTAQDSIKQFIDEQIEFTENIDDTMSGERFNELYRDFCHRNDIIMENKIKVGIRLKKNYGYSDENRKKHSKYGIIYLYIKRKEFQETIEMIEDNEIPEM